MIAARMPAKTSPASGPGVKPSRKAGDAWSGLASGASLPAATSAGTASPTPSQSSTQAACPPPITAGSHLSIDDLAQHVELVQHVRLPQHADREERRRSPRR